MANKYNPWLIICGFCGKEKKDSRARSIESAIEKAKKSGWEQDEYVGLICPTCKKEVLKL